MTTTISHIFDSHRRACAAVTALEQAGVPAHDISIAVSKGTVAPYHEPDHDVGTAAGASVGATLGGGTGLLAALGVVAIPGLGPVIAAGWVAAMAAGAVTGATAGAIVGGLVDVLRQAGESEEDAHVYTEAVRRGSTLLVLRIDDTRVDEARAIIARFDPVDAVSRSREYRAQGWNGFDAQAAPYRLTPAEMDRIRAETRD
ncbi:MAG: hypothetical protein JO055_09570 [Alphaproteobacteria bacterium]|nr:hypothetical protein [Alphaproteobacteria bacterium]